MLTFRLLGALEVVRDARPTDLGGPKQRAVLAALLLDAGRIVSADRLVDVVWGDHPTASATGTLQVYVSNLRRLLRDEDGAASIVRRPPGYLLEVDPDLLDTTRFVALAERAQHAVDDHDWRAAVSTAHEALDLWRGPLLADFADHSWVRLAAVGFDERRVVLRQHLVTGLLGMGHVNSALTRAQRLAAENPLSEQAVRLQMLALYRSARSGEALDVFRGHAKRVSDELGLDVGPALRELQAAILRRDAPLDTWPLEVASTTTGGNGTPVRPRAPGATRWDLWQGRTQLGLLEREHELSRVGHVLDRAQAGVGGAVAVWGPAGIGKSALLARVCATGDSAGMRVLHARGAEMERDFGFGVVRQLLEPALAAANDTERASWLAGLAGRAADLLGLPGGGATVGGDAPTGPSFQILHGLYWLGAQMAADGPTCLVVDDAQWADAASLRWVEYLLPRLVELPLAVVVAIRTGETGPASRSLTALTADPEVEVVEPAPLSPAGVSALLREAAGEAVDEQVVARCHVVTGGNPFLVQQVVAQLRERRSTPVSDAVASVSGDAAVARWVQLRLTRLGDASERLGRAVAVLETASLVQAADLAGLDVATAARQWDTLVDAAILAPGPTLAYTHPLIRTAVYDAIGHAERQAGHRRAAHLLAEAGADVQTVAEHLLVTAPAGDQWAVGQLEAAATAAARSGAPESAATYLTRAVAEPPAPEDRAGTLLALGIAALNAGQPDAIGHLQRSVDVAVDTVTRASAAATLTCALAGSRDERLLASVEVLDGAIALLRADDPAMATAIDTLATGLLRSSLPLTARYRPRIEAVRRRADDPRAPGDVLALAALVAHKHNERADVVQDLARRALRRPLSPLPGPLVEVGRSFLTVQALNALVMAEAPDADEALRAAVDRARDDGDAFALSGALAFRGWHRLFRGDLRGVEADARTALEARGVPVVGFFRIHSVASLVTAFVEMDRVDEAVALLATQEDVTGRATLADAVLRLARGRVRMAQGRSAEALGFFLGVGQSAVEYDFDGPSLLPWRSEAALAHFALGDAERAREFAAVDLERAREFAAPRAMGVGERIYGLVIPGPTGEGHLRAAVEHLALAGAAVDHAHALLDLGSRLRVRGEQRESLRLLHSALELADEVGAARVAKRAVAELRATGTEPRRRVNGTQVLTANERRVADLAAAGSSDREIAESLFTTVRAVEHDLTTVFRKLGIASRADLADTLAG